jgi:UDP-N-acetyl-2-amino-2-deoxyglucuronate dehydrogenase
MTDIAIIGEGEIAGHHLEACHRVKGLKVLAVASPWPCPSQGDVWWTTDYRGLLNRADIQAVDICVPLSQRAQIGIEAAQAGKRIVLEQPAAASLEEVDRLAQACRHAGVTFDVLQAARCQPWARRLKGVVDEGKLGALRVGHFTSIVSWTPAEKQAWDSSEVGSGRFLAESALDTVDVVCWLFGSPVATVFARGCVVEGQTQTPHYANILLRFADGSHVACDIGRTGSPAADAGLQSFSLIGLTGSAASDRHGGTMVLGPEGVRILNMDPVEGLAEAWRQWVASGGAGLGDQGEGARRTVALMLAMAASMRDGQPAEMGG